jgi:hypothetical protein
MEVAMKALIGILIVAACITPLHAQDTATAVKPMTDSVKPPESHPYRNPRRALILGSLIPGAGHIYAGEYWHGVVNYEGTVATIGMGIMTFIVNKCTFSFLSASDCNPGPEWPHQALGVGLVGLGLRQWILSARDAARAAERANERHRRNMAQARPIIGPAGGPHGGWHAGIEIPW